MLRIAHSRPEVTNPRALALQAAARARLSPGERAEDMDVLEDSTSSASASGPSGTQGYTSGDSHNINNKSTQKKYEINFFLSSFGISLVVEKPIRREFLSLYVDGLSLQNISAGPMKTYELQIANFQVDNYSETTIYPVLLHDLKDQDKYKGAATAESGNKDKDKDPPLLTLSLIKEDNGPGTMPIVKYVFELSRLGLGLCWGIYMGYVGVYIWVMLGYIYGGYVVC